MIVKLKNQGVSTRYTIPRIGYYALLLLESDIKPLLIREILSRIVHTIYCIIKYYLFLTFLKEASTHLINQMSFSK